MSRDKIPIACRFHLLGKCNKSASECRFLHNKSAPVSLLCSKFLSGKCSREKCKYKHDKLPSAPVLPSNEICRFFREHGFCRNGDQCPNVHGLLCPRCALYDIHPDDHNSSNHRLRCEQGKQAMCRRYMEPSFSKTCSICHMNVVEQRRRFAILERCNHVFCVPCLREWRNLTSQPKQMTKSCPMCRTHSALFIPSDYWIENTLEKLILFDNHKHKTSQIFCRYLHNGQLSCPFGTKCLYSHDLTENPAIYPEPAMLLSTPA